MSIRLLAKFDTLRVDKTLRDTVRAICSQANDFGIMNSSVDYLAWLTDCDPRTIKRHLVKLRALGAIVKIQASGFHIPCTYRVNLDVFEPKPAFVPKGDNLTEKDIHQGIFVPRMPSAPKGDSLPPVINNIGTVQNSTAVHVPHKDLYVQGEGAKNAPSLAVQSPSPEPALAHGTDANKECVDADDPFAGIGEPVPAPPPPPELDNNSRRFYIEMVSLAERKGALDNKGMSGFRSDWAKEVVPIIQSMFGYKQPTNDCYTVANSLLKKNRPTQDGEPVSFFNILLALERLRDSPQARQWKNNPRVNPYLVPRWLENELARVPETSAVGAELHFF